MHKPASLTFEQAAALPVSGITAVEAVRKAGVTAGQRVLVTGAGGGVGLVRRADRQGGRRARHRPGAHRSASTRCSRSAPTRPSTARVEDVDARGPVYDVIIDTAGRRPLGLLRRAMTPKGTLAIVGGEGGGKVLGGFGRLLLAPMASLFVGQTYCAVTAHERLAELEELVALVESGAVVPHVGRTYPLASGADAVRDLHDGKAQGKLVLTV